MGELRYIEVVEKNEGKVFAFGMDAQTVAVMYDETKMMLTHPDVKVLFSSEFIEVLEKLQDFCLQSFKAMGFTMTEVREIGKAVGPNQVLHWEAYTDIKDGMLEIRDGELCTVTQKKDV